MLMEIDMTEYKRRTTGEIKRDKIHGEERTLLKIEKKENT